MVSGVIGPLTIASVGFLGLPRLETRAPGVCRGVQGSSLGWLWVPRVKKGGTRLAHVVLGLRSLRTSLAKGLLALGPVHTVMHPPRHPPCVAVPV